ncbi:TRAP transporter substrate-binding protein [Thiobacillus sedimenti]|uniref:TRAP transporter substrate-binding protein DctP n=1 Tax=Thiobacillus sedimenti TaxID=3110231 RepID=A0ABZ1CLN1_9PROT|nr:TRAP transporter substrate-binding protein DctP [Thiobacillus sp. SCUT-2]WRS39791.1 TRAP transporter substrate-binding protein DctP [Thiobacillus sp. SCUT-2]
MMPRLFKTLAVCALLWAGAVHAADVYVLKFATLAPQGSTWMKIFEAWGKDLAGRSQGRLTVKFYPGGIAGDEPDMLKKIRFGQLQGAALSGHGVGEIFPPARILEAPFLFRDHAEADAARAAIQPAIEAGFRANQYELLAWMEVGNIHFFSTRPLASLDELARRRIWQWQGDRFIDAFFDANGWSPIALPITEVYPALSTGLVDTVVSTPLASIAMQWAGRTPYMSTQPVATGIGAVVVASRFYASLPPDLQALLKGTGAPLSQRLIADTRRDDQAALALLAKHTQPLTGLQTIDFAEQAARSRKAVAALEARRYLSADLDRQVDAVLARRRGGAN